MTVSSTTFFWFSVEGGCGVQMGMPSPPLASVHGARDVTLHPNISVRLL